MATIYHTATEYTANAITISRGDVEDITGVGLYHTESPSEIPEVEDFTTVELVYGDHPLASGNNIDVIALVGPRDGDFELEPGDYQRWVLIQTENEDIIRRVDVLEIQ